MINKNSTNNNKHLVELIDQLAPLNNRFRIEKDPISKIELMWEFGEIINNYLSNYGIRLHALLYKIYDPHSNVKMSYITRDLGSYCYRINRFFKNKKDIRQKLYNLKNYTVFRESVPLLFNPKYNSQINADVVLSLINSNRDPKLITKDAKQLKQKIRPIKNPRNQKSNLYSNEKIFIQHVYNDLNEFYLEYDHLPDEAIVISTFGNEKYRTSFMNILMSLASDSFIAKANGIKNTNLNEDVLSILAISKSTTDNRARFRKWVMSSTNLLLIAEGIYALNDEDNYQFFRSKFIKKNKLPRSKPTGY